MTSKNLRELNWEHNATLGRLINARQAVRKAKQDPLMTKDQVAMLKDLESSLKQLLGSCSGFKRDPNTGRTIPAMKAKSQ